MKTHRYLIAFVMCVLLLPATRTIAQEDFEEWMGKQNSAMQEFMDARDKQFLEYLEQDWEQFQAYEGLVRDPAPKPPEIPIASAPAEEPLPEAPTVEVHPLPLTRKPQVTIPEPPAIPQTKGKRIRVPFHGHSLKFVLDPAMIRHPTGEATQEAIQNYWKAMSQTDYSSFLGQVEEIGDRLGLNDWGFARLIYAISKEVAGGHQNNRILFSWFVLTKSGYQLRSGYVENTLFLMFASENPVYEIPFLTVDGENYYILLPEAGGTKIRALQTYEQAYPEADDRLSFFIQDAPVFPNEPVELELEFKYGGEVYSVPITLNRNLIQFYDTYPQTDIPIYFGALLSEETARSLLTGLRSVVEGRPETEAVNLLLRFVQTAFRYETDQQQFGRENYLFPEETLFYPASDCEDRSALFAYLVRNLLGLEVIGLDYPGHVATAVKFQADVGRDSVVHNGENYTVADPTFIMAEYGMTMPALRGKTPKVFEIR